MCQRSIQCAHRWHSVVSDGSGLGQQVVAMELWLGSDGELVHGDPLTVQEDTEMRHGEMLRGTTIIVC